MPALAPVHPPLGINASYCVPKQTTLTMKEKVWTLAQDSFHITDQNNQQVLQCKAKTISLSARKEFTDNSGRPLFTLRKKVLSIHTTFYAEAPDEKVLFECKSQWSFGKAKLNATFVNLASDNREIELHIRGSWFDRKANILLDDVVVASISRSFFNARQIFADQDTYYVSVAPGVDLSLIAALCVCLDEKEEEGKK